LKERDIFDAALAIPDPGKRHAFLVAACHGDAALEEHLRVMLEVQPEIGSFLEAPAPVATAQIAPRRTAAEDVGAVIGPYRPLEPIGEGGIGTVYMAEQTHPVRRKVALKVMKPGMDTKQVIARFEAERQALAAGCRDGKFLVVGLDGTRPGLVIRAHDTEVVSLSFSGDGQ
jgi:hypothetical protein